MSKPAGSGVQKRATNFRKTEIAKLIAELKTCGRTTNLERGTQLHLAAVESEVSSCIYVSTALVNMYAKCGSMADARRVFDRIQEPDVVAWTALILGYAENGEAFTALEMFARVKCQIDPYIVVAALKACSSMALKHGGSERTACLERGVQIHLGSGCCSDIYVYNALIDMYSKCGSMLDARQVFDSMRHTDVVSWTALILGYAENGKGAIALDMFARMKSQGYSPDSLTFVASLKACTSLAMEQDGCGREECLERGKQIHLEICSHLDVHLECLLIDMYAKCGSMVQARQVFDSMKRPNVVAWSTLILGYADNGESVTALDMFSRMKRRGCAPNQVTFVAALKACGALGAIESGRKIHTEIKAGTELKPILLTSLVDFYAKCGSMSEAQQEFDTMHHRTRDLVAWTALLAGYSRLGMHRAVFQLFQGMLDAGLQPNEITFLCVLTCCSHAGLVGAANEFFRAMVSDYRISPAPEHYNCMVDILGRSNKLDEAVALLRSKTCRPDGVTWLTLLGACRKWRNVGLGRLAFCSLVILDDGANAAAYMLMGHIYGSRGKWEEQDMVFKMSFEAGKC